MSGAAPRHFTHMIAFQENVPLSQLTNYRIGGPCRYFFAAKTALELTHALQTANEKKLDIFILGSFGLIQPIFAIFVIQGIPGATVATAGIALTIQLFTKAAFQIMVGKWDDEDGGNKRELGTLFIGSLLISVAPLGYALTTTLWQLYVMQFIYGLGGALSFPSWRIIFTRFMNQDRQGYEWGVYDTIVSLATAATAAMGGYIAEQFSFRLLFVGVSLVSFAGTFFIVRIFKQEFTRDATTKSRRTVPHRGHHHRVR